MIDFLFYRKWVWFVGRGRGILHGGLLNCMSYLCIVKTYTIIPRKEMCGRLNQPQTDTHRQNSFIVIRFRNHGLLLQILKNHVKNLVKNSVINHLWSGCDFFLDR